MADYLHNACTVPTADYVPVVIPEVPVVPPAPAPSPLIEREKTGVEFEITGPPGISLGSAIAIDTVTGLAYLASNDDIGAEASGIVISYNSSSGVYTVASTGLVELQSFNLVPGHKYYLGEAGQLIDQPDQLAKLHQFIGTAISSTKLLVEINTSVIL